MATVGRKIGAQKCIKKHIGRKSYRQIKKWEPLFELFLLEKIIKEVNETHHLLSYTEGDWGVVKTVIQKLRNEKAHRRFACKKGSKGKGLGKTRKSSKRRQIIDRIGKISRKVKKKIGMNTAVDENDAKQDVDWKRAVSDMNSVQENPDSHRIKHSKRIIPENLSSEDENDEDKSISSDTDLEQENSDHSDKKAVLKKQDHGNAAKGVQCAVKGSKMK